MAIDPIRHLVVLAHPRRGSFNHQIAQAYCDTVEACGQRPFLRDLYLNRFDPVLEYLGEAPELEVVYDLTEIRRCDVVVFIYPIWFGGPPAMIKGYVDRVLGAGFKPSHDHAQAHNPFLKGRHMISFSTSASTQAWLGEQGQLTALREGFDQYLGTIFQLAATEHVHIDAVVEGLSEHYAAEQLERVREAARTMCATVLDAAHRAEMARLAKGEIGQDAAPAA
jgi:NAD(P)H dehydrogenase (quinone)